MSIDLFGTPTLIGLKVRLDRPVDRERPCCRNICIIGPAEEPYAGSLRCVDCGRHRGRISKTTAQWIERVAARFGAPTTPIVVRKAYTYEEETPPRNGEVDKQRQIDEISALIALEGFTPKDFFLTQPPPPTEKFERARWRAREQRRRPIARRMALLGLTAHDLARDHPSFRKSETAIDDGGSKVVIIPAMKALRCKTT